MLLQVNAVIARGLTLCKILERDWAFSKNKIYKIPPAVGGGGGGVNHI